MPNVTTAVHNRIVLAFDFDETLAPNTYNADSELLQSILLAVESIAKRIALRQLGRGE